MSREKLRIANTEIDNLIGNLRGEVGECITTWVLMRHFIGAAARLQTDDPAKDLANESLTVHNLLTAKLEDELIARLSELAEEKVGQITFHLAAIKLAKFNEEVLAYQRLVVAQKLRTKRNQEISHKNLPETWTDHRHLTISYRAILGTLAGALRLMKRIDRFYLGPSAPYLWREMRKRRYQAVHPPRAGYFLLPHLNLSEKERLEIVVKEAQEGQQIWSEMTTTVNGTPTKILACRKWGVIVLGNQMMALATYPLQAIGNVTVN